MPPDSTDTKRRLLAAAFDEFARYGLAGARVDRIAELAKANKRLIYAYFGNKEQLFDTVVVDSLGVLADAVPFTADDLAGYAGDLFDHMVAHPEMVRLTMWKLLERPAVSAEETAVYQPKVAALACPDRRGADGTGTGGPADPGGRRGGGVVHCLACAARPCLRDTRAPTGRASRRSGRSRRTPG